MTLLSDGCEFSALTVVVNHNRLCPGDQAGQSPGENVVAVMETVKQEYKAVPNRIQVDDGREFPLRPRAGGLMRIRCPRTSPDPGNPRIMPIFESFNGSFGDECLNTNWLLPLEDAQVKVEAYGEHNCYAPHRPLGA